MASGAAGTAGQNFGVVLQGGADVITTAGDVQISGTGGAGSGSNHGVIATGAGTSIQVSGTSSTASNIIGLGAAAGAIGNNVGVVIAGDADVLTTNAVNVMNISGTGAGTGDASYGVQFVGAGTTGIFAGKTTIQGTGSTAGTSNNNGVFVNTAASLTFAHTVSVITGTGGGTTAGAGSYNDGVLIAGNSSVTFNNTTGSGTALITGQGGKGTGGNNVGVAVGHNGGAANTHGIVNVTAGNAKIEGLGGDGDLAQGVYVGSSSGVSTVTNSGAGSVQIIGKGGATGVSGAEGVRIIAETAGSRATLTNSGGGTLGISGTGGGAAAAASSRGVAIYGALVQNSTAATGTINISGAGSAGTGGGNVGVIIANNSTRAQISDQSTAGGTINISGTGGGGSASHGVLMEGSLVEQTVVGAKADIRVTGVAGSASSSGIVMRESTLVPFIAAITSASTAASGLGATPAAGNIQLTGSATNASGGYGIRMESNSSIGSANANIYLNASATNTASPAISLANGTVLTTGGNLCLSGSGGALGNTFGIELRNDGAADNLISGGASSLVSITADATRGGIGINNGAGTKNSTITVGASGTITLQAPQVIEYAGGRITGNSLALRGTGLFDLDQTANNVNRLSADIDNTGSDSRAILLYTDANGFDVANITTACVTCNLTGGFTASTIAGLQVGAVGTSGGSETNRITLSADGNVRQEADAPIITSKLNLIGRTTTGANYYFANTLANAGGFDTAAFNTNNIDVLTGNVPSVAAVNGHVHYRDADGFTVSSLTGGAVSGGSLANNSADSAVTGLTTGGNIALLADVAADNNAAVPDITVTTLINRSGTQATNTLLRANRDINILSNADIEVTGASGSMGLILNSDFNQANGATDFGGRVQIVGATGGGANYSKITTLGGDVVIGGGAFSASDGTQAGVDAPANVVGAMLNAQGRNVAGVGNTDDGVSMLYARIVTSDGVGAGDVTIRGAGASQANQSQQIGVAILESTINTGSGGNIVVSGIGGTNTGTGTDNFGVGIGSSTLTTAGAGTIDVTGTGGLSSGDNNIGVAIGANPVLAGGSNTISQINSTDGAIFISGTGAGTGGFAHGVFVNGVSTGAANKAPRSVQRLGISPSRVKALQQRHCACSQFWLIRCGDWLDNPVLFFSYRHNCLRSHLDHGPKRLRQWSCGRCSHCQSVQRLADRCCDGFHHRDHWHWLGCQHSCRHQQRWRADCRFHRFHGRRHDQHRRHCVH